MSACEGASGDQICISEKSTWRKGGERKKGKTSISSYCSNSFPVTNQITAAEKQRDVSK